MADYYGNIVEDATVYIPFNTFSSDDPSASVTITDLVQADVEVWKDGVVQGTPGAGVTLTLNIGANDGSHLIAVDTSNTTDAGFFVTGADYQVRINGTTVDGATINAWVGSFSIENRFMRGTDSAALATVGGALDDAAAAGAVTEGDTLMQYMKQLINILIGGPGIATFPAEAAPANGVSLAEVIRAIHADVTGLNGAAMGDASGALSVSGAGYVGDFGLEEIVHFSFSTTGAMTDVGDEIRVFKEDDDTQLTTAQAVLDDVDGETNVWEVAITLGQANYDVESNYSAVLSGATIGGNLVTAVVATFSVENRYQEPVQRYNE